MRSLSLSPSPSPFIHPSIRPSVHPPACLPACLGAARKCHRWKECPVDRIGRPVKRSNALFARCRNIEHRGGRATTNSLSRWPRTEIFLSLSPSPLLLLASQSPFLSLSRDNGVLSVVVGPSFFLTPSFTRSLARVVVVSLGASDPTTLVSRDPTSISAYAITPRRTRPRLPLYGGKDASDEIRPSVANRCREQYLLFSRCRSFGTILTVHSFARLYLPFRSHALCKCIFVHFPRDRRIGMEFGALQYK